jgi:hypothetical protein
MSLDIDQIGAVVAAAKRAGDEFMALVEGLSQLTMQSSRSEIVFNHEELQIQIGMRGRFARTIERLKQIEPLRLSVAPVVAAVFSADESDVLVLRYWAIPGEQRLAFDREHQPTDTARHRFRDDLTKLADAGWMHAYALRGTLYWRVTSKTGTMVLDDWQVLQPIEDEDEIRARLAGMA